MSDRTVQISTDVHERPVMLDIDDMLSSRVLIQGASRSGKSYLMRRICELVGEHVPVFVIDPEGEFSSLRERLDLVVVGYGGELQPDPRTARVLARRLFEAGVSAVLDLYELDLDDRSAFVAGFLRGLIDDIPRDDWAPRIVAIDEAHLFAREGDKGSDVTRAVVDLVSRGGKRGLCSVLATQRVSKLAKDAADAHNLWIGKTTLDVDLKRCGDLCGFASKADRLRLRDLRPGWFYAFGPALDFPGVERIHTTPVETTHPEAGKAHTFKPPAAPEGIARLAAELADLSAKDEEVEVDPAKRETDDTVDQLRQSLADLSKQAERNRSAALTLRERFLNLRSDVQAAIEQGGRPRPRPEPPSVDDVLDDLDEESSRIADLYAGDDGDFGEVETVDVGTFAEPAKRVPAHTSNGVALTKGARRVLAAVHWWRRWFEGEPTRAQIAVVAGYSPTSGHVSGALARLREAGLLDGLTPTGPIPYGLPEIALAPSPQAFQSAAIDLAPEPVRPVLQAVLGRSEPFARKELAKAVGQTSTSGSLSDKLATLRRLGMITPRSPIGATDWLHPKRRPQ